MKPNGTAQNASFHFVMIKPTHYDNDGYPIQWLRSTIPSNTLGRLKRIRAVAGFLARCRVHLSDFIELRRGTWPTGRRWLAEPE